MDPEAKSTAGWDGVVQGCNFVNFSRGHVGPWNKNFRSPHENLRAHNEDDEIRFISVKIPKQFNCGIIFYSYTYVNWLKAHWKSSLDPGLSTLKLSIIHVKQIECCKYAPVFEFVTSLYQLIRCHTRHKISFYKINTFTVQVTKMDACVVKQYEWRICIIPWFYGSCQVGDQFLISGSPQTRFGRIGEWATGNLQPWL